MGVAPSRVKEGTGEGQTTDGWQLEGTADLDPLQSTLGDRDTYGLHGGGFLGVSSFIYHSVSSI